MGYCVNDLILRFSRHTPKCREVLKGEAASVGLLFAYLYLKGNLLKPVRSHISCVMH